MKPLIRATQLEQFRRFISDKYEYMTEQDVINTCTGVFEGNVKTRIGSALHSIVENGTDVITMSIPAGVRQFTYYGKPCSEPVQLGKVVSIERNNIIFDEGQIALILNYKKSYPYAFHEQRKQKDYGKVVITGCADMIDGSEIRDIKTKFSAPSDDDYIDSYQWRIYCDLFEADRFSFDLFEFEDYSETKHLYDVRGLNLRQHDPIVVYPYEHMHQDILNLIDDFVDFAKSRNFYDSLTKI